MTRHVLAALVSLCAVWGTASRGHAAEPRVAVFALVVANNQSLDPDVKPLRYADDDAARFYELMQALEARTHLLTVLDAETQQLFPFARLARPPRLDVLRESMTDLVAAMRQARAQGLKTVFYFYFAGHGDVGSDREGYISLLDGRLRRSDLYRDVIARSPADINHIVIDACNSYFVVNTRSAATYRRAIRSFLQQESLERYPNTGVILSTATMAESHEWSRYRSGVFSHQLLSALWGGADVDGDGRVTYHELAAYVAAANLKVRDVRARVALFSRPPRSQRQVSLVALAAMRRVQAGEPRPAPGRVAAFLKLPASLTGHYYLEDDRGVRYLDFNKSTEQPLTLALLDRRHYYLRSEEREALVRLDQPEVDAGSLAFAEIPLRARGVVEESFRRDLYAFPFGQSFAAGYSVAEGADGGEVAAQDEPGFGPRPWYGRLGVWKWSVGGLALAALASGVSVQIVAARNADKLDRAGVLTFQQATDLQATIGRQQAGAGIAFGIAGSAAATALVLFLLDRSTLGSRSRVTAAGMVTPGAAGMLVGGDF